MILKSIQRIALLRRICSPLIDRWFRNKTKIISTFLYPDEKILDLGSGNCCVAKILKDMRHDVTPVDVKNLSVYKDIQPIVYDGNALPFEDDKFDCALLLTVLHHTTNPEQILKEAKRVSKKIIILEDTYNNRFQKWITQSADTIVNLGHSKMTYENKSEKEWEKLFDALGLHLQHKITKRKLLFFQQTTYNLKK